MQYEIVANDDVSYVKDTITRMLLDGWQLAGGIAVTNEGNTAIFAQALVKPIEKRK